MYVGATLYFVSQKAYSLHEIVVFQFYINPNISAADSIAHTNDSHSAGTDKNGSKSPFK